MKNNQKICLIVLLCIVLLFCTIYAVSCIDDGTEQNSLYTVESAYNKAKELGFDGTQDDFIAALKSDGKGDIVIKSVELNSAHELIVRNAKDIVILRQKLPLCNHTYNNSVEGLLPTCTSAGYNYRTCSKCGNIQYQIVPALEHDWDDGVVVYQADCTRNGLIVYSCANCELTKSEIVSSTGEHKYQNDICVYCNNSRAQILDNYYNGSYGYEYLYSMDNGDNMVALYDTIHNAVMRFHNDAQADAVVSDGKYVLLTIDKSDYNLTINQAVAVWKTYLDDKPLYYWLAKSATIVGDETLVICVDNDYAQGAVRAQYNSKLYKLIDEYKSIADGESAYSVAFAYHDKIISSIDYAYKDRYVPEDAPWAHSIVGVFEGKGAVCEGYSRAFQLLLNTRNIPNVFVAGQSRGEDHAWNLVQLDNGNWYWYDLTWDDTPNAFWGVSHYYLCATDTDFLQNHTFNLPTNTGIEFQYALPGRATEPYNGNDIKYLEKFVENDAACIVVGYNMVSISHISAVGDYEISQTVTYRGRDFTVVSLVGSINDAPDGFEEILKNEDKGLSLNTKLTSITIPSTVVYIGGGPLSSSYLQNIFVDEANPKFRSLDGVLYTKDLVTLIQYPAANLRTEYVIPEQTYYIARAGLDGARNIQSLTIGKNLTLLGIANWGWGYPNVVGDLHNVIGRQWGSLMSWLPSTALVIVDEENPYYKVVDQFLLDKSETVLYAGLPGATHVVIPQSVTRIEDDAFWANNSLVSVTFTSPIQALGRYLFANCNNLVQVTLTEGMEDISEGMFSCCHSIKSITIPSSVIDIGVDAFRGCGNLEEVIILDGVQTIGERVFDCLSLKKLVIPSSVKTIGENVIGKDDDLYAVDTKNLYVYFEGSSEEWDAISKDNAFSDKQLNEMNLYFYSETKPTNPGNYWHYIYGVITKWNA